MIKGLKLRLLIGRLCQTTAVVCKTRDDGWAQVAI